MVRTIHQNSKDCLGSFGLIGNYTDVCVQVTGDDARRAGRQRCSGRPARKALGALRFVCGVDLNGFLKLDHCQRIHSSGTCSGFAHVRPLLL